MFKWGTIITSAPKSHEFDRLPILAEGVHQHPSSAPSSTSLATAISGKVSCWHLNSGLRSQVWRLDSNNPVHRPITNVLIILKTIEKIVVTFQVTLYPETNSLLPVIQSGFWKGDSTKTLLLCFLSDVYGPYGTNDRFQQIRLALFDVSAAFTTADQEILVE